MMISQHQFIFLLRIFNKHLLAAWYLRVPQENLFNQQSIISQKFKHNQENKRVYQNLMTITNKLVVKLLMGEIVLIVNNSEHL